ncbi:cupin domain-containing protein [Nocardia sp. NPDC005366]|uniref:cupin domain-containing protein n=1 Tax=Nocardia sp. NPDC005366 TaxID=3156878 RepID=UPI0033A52079
MNDRINNLAVDTAAWVPRDGEAPNAERLLRGNGLTLVRISFRHGQVLDDHRAPGPILIQCLSGAIDLEVTTEAGRQSHRLDAGSVIHVDANNPHRLRAIDDAVVHVVLHRNVAAPTA